MNLNKERLVNLLANEKSPYLLQHAGNPVDWRPWSEEAFAEARRLDKPVFISIGYAACHWCHVMERESFENEEAAHLLNDAFVCVKVDREERPDVDDVYMTACQMFTGAGGWPLTIVATPDKEPFFAATYLPLKSAPGRIGVMDLARQVKAFWASNRQDAVQAAQSLADQLKALEQSFTPSRPEGSVNVDELRRSALDTLEVRFDPRHGGFGPAPKFPTPPLLAFLLRAHDANPASRALPMLDATLKAMRAGGLWDHVGLGFHRYSTDETWLLPHFEKMLYDQALLASIYLETAQATGDASHADTARNIFTFVQREMTSPQGAFYSGLDADSEGEEGKFYVWTAQEVRDVLGRDDAALFMEAYGFEEAGNYLDEASGRRTGANIPHLPAPLPALAERLGVEPNALEAKLAGLRARLLDHRGQRIRPLTDDKILTDWNGLMIAALAFGSRVLSEPELAERARKAADFILNNLRDERGRLLRRYREGEAAHSGLAADYAFFLLGLTELLQTEAGIGLEAAALGLARELIARHRDAASGAFYTTAEDGEQLIVRKKEFFDGALPSANSAAVLALIRLGRLTEQPDIAAAGRTAATAFSDQLKATPLAGPFMLAALLLEEAGLKTVTINGPSSDPAVQEMLKALASKNLSSMLARRSVQGEPEAVVCVSDRCLPPVHDAKGLLEILHREF